jgi:hypothetical protein
MHACVLTKTHSYETNTAVTNYKLRCKDAAQKRQVQEQFVELTHDRTRRSNTLKKNQAVGVKQRKWGTTAKRTTWRRGQKAGEPGDGTGGAGTGTGAGAGTGTGTGTGEEGGEGGTAGDGSTGTGGTFGTVGHRGSATFGTLEIFNRYKAKGAAEAAAEEGE